MIELINVSKKYVTKAGNTQALNNVSLKFADKGLVFIVGKSGCGKTTLLNVIGGLDNLDSGDIIVGGKKFSEFTPKDYDSYRNTLVGFIFQEYNLLSDYNIEKNIDIANELQGKKAKEEDIEKLLKTVDIGGHEKRRPYQLSGGQKQRAAIARALIKNPKIVLADEPTGALDSATGVQVMELLKELANDKLIIVVSHEIEFAEKYADRIIRLVDGQVVEDITQKDVEVKDVVHEFEGELIVKAGADLNSEETKLLAKAIKEKKKINITEKICVKQKENTKEIKGEQEENKNINFIHSKMKFKSVAGLGLKSLVAKPIRLIFTVLLSIIAFAMFGVFDAVGSFNDERALVALLEGDSYRAVSIYSQYNGDGYDNADFKISQSQIDNLNRQTNYSFRGIYDIKDINDDFVNGSKKRENFNESYVINDPSQNNYVTTGGDYYLKEFNGIVEFKQSEIVDDVILPDQFNYEIIYGKYPTLKTEDEEYQGVGISSYMAKNIFYWMRLNKTEEFGGKKGIKSSLDLVGAELKISSINTRTFIIKAIIDCGEIPKKYSKLKDMPADQTSALSQDFITYINAGCYLNLFLPEGYVQGIREDSNRKTLYFGDYNRTDYYGVLAVANGAKKIYAKPFYYNANEFDETNSILFEDIENNNNPQGAPTLQENEILINANNLLLLFDYERHYNNGSGAKPEQVKAKINAIVNASTPEAKREKTKEFLELMKEVYGAPNYKYNSYLKRINYKGFRDEQEMFAKTLIVKGFYFDANTDLDTKIAKENFYEPFVMSEKGLKSLDVSTNQGIYSRAISPLKENSKGAQILGDMMNKDDGLCIRWYKNSVIETLEFNAEFMGQLLQLFLYVSLAIIVFSMFMLMNYITTSIASKRHTIGILRALGAKGKNILVMFLFESLIIALINGILAGAVGYVASLFVNKYIVEIMNLTISFALFGVRQILIILGVSLATGVISSLLPIRRIIKEKPVALIRKGS